MPGHGCLEAAMYFNGEKLKRLGHTVFEERYEKRCAPPLRSRPSLYMTNSPNQVWTTVVPEASVVITWVPRWQGDVIV